MLSSSSAIDNNADGTAGNAPCLENYIVAFDWDLLGSDPHATHGLQTSDGAYVAVGSGLESSDSKYKNGFIIKTSGSCTTYTDYDYVELSASATDCDKTWDWITTFGTTGKYDIAIWSALSTDKTYIIVVG